MSMHRSIRDTGKRFQIVLYHLEKIIEDWGNCRGLSANDVSKLRIGAYAEIKRLFESHTIGAFYDAPFIPEEEFDNKSQVDTILEDKNRRLQEELDRCKEVILNIQKQIK